MIFPTLLFGILVFLLGAALGSFVNVISLRYNTGLSFVRGKSRCLKCNQEIGGENLFPIFSYVYLWGRCAFCKSRLSISYLLVEVFSGFFLLYLYLNFEYLNLSILSFILLSIIYYLLALIFTYDLRHKIIPDPFVFSFVVFSILYSFFNLSLSQSLIGLVLIPAPFFLIWLFSGGKLLGFGDVKLMAGMGAFLGVSGGFTSVFLSFWIGAGFILILYIYEFIYKKIFRKGYNITSNMNWKSEVPFAPFLCIGTLVEFFFHIKLW